MDSTLNTRLLAEAKNSVVASRSCLAPVREAIVAFRARGCSYERITAILRRHGVEIHGSALGYFCRRYITRAEIERARRELVVEPTASITPIRSETALTRRTGPRIARDEL